MSRKEINQRLTNSPTPVEGINELIYNKNYDDPKKPTCNVCCCTKDPTFAGTGHSGSQRVGIFGNSGTTD
jgi:hypothetical protein